jgi:DNA-binding NarL/FixJ family response regulator
MKQEASELILTALRILVRGGIFLSEPMKEKMLQSLIEGRTQDKRFGIDRLSDREIEVLRFVGCGFSTRQIAEKLHLSVKTIEVYRANLKNKLRLQNGPELVQYAIQWLQDEGSSTITPSRP